MSALNSELNDRRARRLLFATSSILDILSGASPHSVDVRQTVPIPPLTGRDPRLSALRARQICGRSNCRAEAAATHSGSYPAVDTTKSDPQTRFAGLLVTAQNGAMLKIYPASPNYTLEYLAATHTINVFAAGTPYSTTGPMTTGALGAGAAGCALLS
jgi:hypothetical protein